MHVRLAHDPRGTLTLITRTGNANPSGYSSFRVPGEPPIVFQLEREAVSLHRLCVAPHQIACINYLCSPRPVAVAQGAFPEARCSGSADQTPSFPQFRHSALITFVPLHFSVVRVPDFSWLQYSGFLIHQSQNY
jgi:hypothetical protein